MKPPFATTRNNGTPSTTRTDTWKVTPAKTAPAPRHLLGRVFRREEPSTFQRCLAVHIHFASPRGGLS
jgi:hypothetical protein